MTIPLSVRVLSLALLSLTAGQEAPEKAAVYVCPPCGAECHFKSYPKIGNCGVCGMGLVPLASVPQVGVLIHPEAGLGSSLPVLALFAESNAVRVFTVADTDDPVRLGDSIEVRPQFTLAAAPPLDVLVIPEIFGVWNDPLILEWVKSAATKARCVLAVGPGVVLLAKAGFLAGEHVPGKGILLKRGKELAPELVFDAETSWRRAGRFFLARDSESALDASFAIVAELIGEDKARRAAQDFGRTLELTPPVAK
jgi:transcriptional regulator GlxA family with amidase domain